MTQPFLSILIPTVVGREKELDNLLSIVSNSCLLDIKANLKTRDNYTGIKYDCEIFEVIVVKDNKSATIGSKREYLYSLSTGVFSWQIDDDDNIANNAIELILEAIKSNPEIPCITFREKCMMNGIYKSSNHSIKYEKWQDNFDGFDYVRCAFYKDIIRTDLARQVPFEHIRYNEDERWSMAIKPLLTSEIHVDEELYHYIYNETPHNERYGIDK